MSLEVLDWRRRTSALYAAVRAESSPRVAHGRWVRGRDHLLRTHPASPVPAARRAHFPGADVAPYDPDLRFEAEPVPGPPLRVALATATDGVVPFVRLGVVDLPGLGTLDVWWLESYGGGVWLPVHDPWEEAYGGGRYVLDTVKGADLGGRGGRLVVDLNFAYNPSCAYDEAWACPLAPPGNRLPLPVPVGERVPRVAPPGPPHGR